MRELKAKLSNRQPVKRVVKKKCDHAHVINQLDTTLKGREQEFVAIRDELVKALKVKEKALQQNVSAIKSYRGEIDLLKKQKLNTDAGVMGFDRMNDLTAQFREVKAKNTELANEVKYMNNISTMQNRELERIDDIQNFSNKIKFLVQELQKVNSENRKLTENLTEVRQEHKKNRKQEIHLESQIPRGHSRMTGKANQHTDSITIRPTRSLVSGKAAGGQKQRRAELAKLDKQQLK